MTVIDATLGARVLELARSARRELVLCAPFVKAGVLQKILGEVDRSTVVTLFTRWRPEEVAAGVSDTDVLPLVREHGGDVWLHDRLHAKFYRSESQALMGSANLTGAALGWSPTANLELLLNVDTNSFATLEERLRQESTEATEDLAREMDDIAEHLAFLVHERPQIITEAQPGWVWVPLLRQPQDLYVAYSHGFERLAVNSAAAARQDLAALECPAGLGRGQFYRVVSARLRQQPIVHYVDDYLVAPRRFGEVAEFLGAKLSLEREEAQLVWQTLMRWLLEFLPNQYGLQVPNWSEVMYRIPHGAGQHESTD